MIDNPDLRCARGWLARASDVLTGAEDYMSAGDYARTAAIIGSGYVALAHAERAAASSATLDAAAERVRRAAAEARPHDDEHADDCHGCDGPGIVPCAADRVVGDVAYRDGEPIKNLARPHDNDVIALRPGQLITCFGRSARVTETAIEFHVEPGLRGNVVRLLDEAGQLVLREGTDRG